MPYQETIDFGPNVPREAFARTRDFEGYSQYRECEGDPWRFYICGFDHTSSGEAGFCTVLMSDGTEDRVPIDAQDRILIKGRWYGRAHWNH